jgi:hypothetical protein
MDAIRHPVPYLSEQVSGAKAVAVRLYDSRNLTSYAPYAKGNFTFDRVIHDRSSGITVLDLRRKR